MRFAKLIALLFAACAWQTQALGQETRPPSRSFGPDTYRIGVFTGEGTPTGLACAPSGAGRECNGYLASSLDGTRLDVQLRIPGGTGPHPLVVVLHG